MRIIIAMIGTLVFSTVILISYESDWSIPGQWLRQNSRAVGAASQIGIIVVTLGLVVWAGLQAMLLKGANRQSYRQQHANLLLELDRRWESPEMQNSRILFHTLSDHVTILINRHYPNVTGRRRVHLWHKRFCEELDKMQNQRKSQYMELMRICGFFETVGYLESSTRRDIPLEDIIQLLGGTVHFADNAFRLHIRARRIREGLPAGFYEKALYLADEVRSYMGLRLFP